MDREFTPAQKAMHEKLMSNLPLFARLHIKIKVKKGGAPQPLVFNKAQQYIHECIEKMLREIGWVRVIIIKGRQQGASTYVCARFYHAAVSIPGTNVYILTHEAKATTVLFGKVALANELCPDFIKPGIVQDNRTTLSFTNKSEYAVGTAGSANTGRSLTAQRMHPSEAAFYEDAESLDAGVMQIVPLLPGTEVIYESTCNGMNWFYTFVKQALAGKNKYRVIFVPWFWTDEYRLKPPSDVCSEDGRLMKTAEEMDLVRIHKLDDQQLYWRRDKIVELKSLKKFKQEYPCDIDEAFQSSSDGFYDSEILKEAMRSSVKAVVGARVLGVDPAGDGGDRTVFCLRRGREIMPFWKYDSMDHIRAANLIAGIIDKGMVDKVLLDKAYGLPIYDLLKERGYGRYIELVSFSETPDQEDIYANKRAEMAFEFKEWMEDGATKLPDDNDMLTDITSMPEPKQNHHGKWVFPPKREIKKAIGHSPDILDAILLTFARRIRAPREEGFDNSINFTRNTAEGSGISTLRRVRNGFDEGREKRNFRRGGGI